MGTNRTKAAPLWSVDLAAVTNAALSIATDADVIDFYCAAIELGAPSAEAGLIGELIFEKRRRAYGCIR